MKKTYHAIGLMSGSSLDGLDVAYCRFNCEITGAGFKIIDWQIVKAETFPFSGFWKNRLLSLSTGSAFELMDAHAAFGQHKGELVNRFFLEKNIDPKIIDLIASHGHTVFHEPAEGFTTQIGDGAALAISTKCKTINDFRSSDIALGGQGAPLAPMADKMLFPGFDFYLNLGGIANITCNIKSKTRGSSPPYPPQGGTTPSLDGTSEYNPLSQSTDSTLFQSYPQGSNMSPLEGGRGVNDRFIAFDICGANQILNALANKLNLPFDNNGELAKKGTLNKTLFVQQKNIDFFKKSYPKSLSNQWVQNNQAAIFLENKIERSETPDLLREVENKLNTAVELIAQLIIDSIESVIEKENFKKEGYKLLVAGGGAYNIYLMERIQFYLKKKNIETIIPKKNIIGFKEAALMALLGVMRLENIPNCMASVTGAERDSIGGAVFYP